MIACQKYHEGCCFTPPKTSIYRTDRISAERDLKIACNEAARAAMDSTDGSVLLDESCAAHLLDYCSENRVG